MTYARRYAPFALGTLVAASLAGLSATTAQAAPPPPSGAHPRIFLSSTVVASMKQAMTDPNSAVSAEIALCQSAIDTPIMDSGYEGEDWSLAASACALAWQLTGDMKYATAGLTLLRALLEDVDKMGDKMACVPNATAEQAGASIKRDTGYAIRFIGPHAALAYDWLHEAPGATALLQQARDCFRAWITFYTANGYLADEPDANYEAGYVGAKTLISIAEAGEDGASSDQFWTETVDTVFTKELIGNGLAMDTGGVPMGYKKGAMVGGDWAEGWQYGPLSVVEYAFATRALEEQGVTLDPMGAWASDVALREIYGLLPDLSGQYVGGDCDDDTIFTTVQTSPFDVAQLGPGSDQAVGYGAFMRNKISNGKPKRTSVWQAVADTRAVTPADPTMAGLAPWYLAKGPRNLYVRSDWSANAYWSVFTSSPRQVDDHQHMDATNFVFVRGADPLIVDPSPYGSRSSLTSNALTIDSVVVEGTYKPSQTDWSTADMPIARGTMSGVVASRGDFANAFNFSDTPSDITFARRDWVFLPEGEIVTIDRATTPSATAKLYLRFRTMSKLTTASASPFIATATSGGSQVAIHAVALHPATPPVLQAVATANDCGDNQGNCRVSRIDGVWEYSWEVPGPDVSAIHVIDGLAAADMPADVAPIDSAPIDTTPAQNAGVMGASVYRSQKQTFVLEPTTLPPPATLTYGVPGTNSSRHVVFDAPVDANGKTTVTATAQGGRCVLTLTAGPGVTGVPAIFTVAPASAGCTVSEDADVQPGTVSPGKGGFDKPGGGGPGGGASGGGGTGGGVSGSGCSCAVDAPGPAGLGALGGAILVGLALARGARRARRPRR